ncbi:MAG TPA: DUF3011 domain-containing protein [Longimicrobium sp.]|nr:DUF3011 domain-containing protein [Longimicrobium sp.]
MHKLGYAVALAAALWAIPGTAKAQSTVTCESSRGRRETCRVDTRGEVRLVQQLSDSRCIRGRTWGTLPGAVWVDDGCRARFAVYGSRGGNNGYDDRWDRDRNGRYGNNDRNGRDGWGNGRNGRMDGSWAISQCRQAVRREIGNRRLDLYLRENSGNRARVEWSATGNRRGTCTVDRNGRVDVRYDRRR